MEHTTEHSHKKDSFLSAYIIGASILVGCLLVSATLVYLFRSYRGEGAVVAEKAPAGAVAKIALADDVPFLGNPKAKVVVVEYADYRCPFCEKFYTDVMPILKEKYIDTGKIKFVYQDFAFLGPDSLSAGEATHCAGDQGAFWQFHDYIFNNFGGESSDWASKANQKKNAQTLGLNTTQFNNCMDSGKYSQRVKDQTTKGASYGVTGTPTVFVNGKALVGALPAQEFVNAIDEALKN
jgi:protein-disulfide isomerase